MMTEGLVAARKPDSGEMAEWLKALSQSARDVEYKTTGRRGLTFSKIASNATKPLPHG